MSPSPRGRGSGHCRQSVLREATGECLAHRQPWEVTAGRTRTTSSCVSWAHSFPIVEIRSGERDVSDKRSGQKFSSILRSRTWRRPVTCRPATPSPLQAGGGSSVLPLCEGCQPVADHPSGGARGRAARQAPFSPGDTPLGIIALTSSDDIGAYPRDCHERPACL